MSLNSPGVADLIIDYCISPERFKQILKNKEIKNMKYLVQCRKGFGFAETI